MRRCKTLHRGHHHPFFSLHWPLFMLHQSVDCFEGVPPFPTLALSFFDHLIGMLKGPVCRIWQNRLGRHGIYIHKYVYNHLKIGTVVLVLP